MKIALKPGIELFETQLSALKYFCKESHAADFSEMGAGKTWPQCLLAKGVIDDNLCDYVLIVAPKAVKSDWYEVFTDIMDCDYKKLVTKYYGPKIFRDGMRLKPIIITTYETIIEDIERFLALARTKRCMVIWDEAHKLRTPGERSWNARRNEWVYTGSKRTALATELSWLCKRVSLLTGTPIVNGLKNAYSYINILRPKQHYNSFRHFQLKHMRFKDRVLIKYDDVEKVENILAGMSIRVLKRQIMKLPPVTFVTRHLEWDPRQKAYYKELQTENFIELEHRFIEALDAGARLVRLHQIITNPQLLGLSCDSTRFAQLDEDLEAIGIEQNKVVIFAHYRGTIDRLKKKYAHLNPAVVYGGTSDIDAEKAKFNKDPSCRLFIAHPQSAGIGINLTVSSYVIFFEYSYDLDSYDQAISRVDRPGQKKDVTIINYALRGSMEEKRILPSLRDKKRFSMALLRDPEEFMAFISFDEEEELMAA